jgi:hypothetical protein
MTMSNAFTRIMYGGQASAYATAATPASVLPRVQSFDPDDDNQHAYEYGIGEGLNPVATYLGPYKCAGKLVFNVTPEGLDFLKYWVGPKTGSGTSGTPYILTEATATALATTALQPFTLEAANTYEATDTVDRYIGCIGTVFTLSGEINGPLKCDASFTARHSVSGSTATNYTPSTSSSFMMLNGTWKWGGTPTAIAGVKRFSVTHECKHDFEGTRTIGSRFVDMPVVGVRTYGFVVDILMASTLASTIMTNFYGQSPASGPLDGSTAVVPNIDLEFSVELVNGNAYATLWLDNCAIDRIKKTQSVEGNLTVLTFEGTARNGKAGYPIRWWTV